MNRPLRTERLELRPFGPGDAEGWHGIWCDPEVITWGPFEDRATSLGAFQGLLAQERTWPDGVGWLAVRERGRPEVVGDVLMQPARFVEGIELGWHMRRRVQGRGYATEAVRAVAERALREGACDALHALVGLDNAASLRVARRLGMEPAEDLEYEGLPHRRFVLRASAG